MRFKADQTDGRSCKQNRKGHLENANKAAGSCYTPRYIGLPYFE